MNATSLLLMLSLLSTADQPSWQCWPYEGWIRARADLGAVERDVRQALLGQTPAAADPLLRLYGYERSGLDSGSIDIDGSLTGWPGLWKITYQPTRVLSLLDHSSWLTEEPRYIVLRQERGRIVQVQVETPAGIQLPQAAKREYARPLFPERQARARPQAAPASEFRLQEWLDNTRRAANPAAERADHFIWD